MKAITKELKIFTVYVRGDKKKNQKYAFKKKSTICTIIYENLSKQGKYSLLPHFDKVVS